MHSLSRFPIMNRNFLVNVWNEWDQGQCIPCLSSYGIHLPPPPPPPGPPSPPCPPNIPSLPCLFQLLPQLLLLLQARLHPLLYLRNKVINHFWKHFWKKRLYLQKKILRPIKRQVLFNEVQKTGMLSVSWFTHNWMSKAQGAIQEFASSAVLVWPCWLSRALSNHTQHFEYTNRWNFISTKSFYCNKQISFDSDRDGQ